MRPLLYFLETINANGKRYLFSFREIAVSKGQKFCMMTYQDHEPVIFEMTSDQYNNWKVNKPAPQWIVSMESKLIEVVKSKIALH